MRAVKNQEQKQRCAVCKKTFFVWWQDDTERPNLLYAKNLLRVLTWINGEGFVCRNCEYGGLVIK